MPCIAIKANGEICNKRCQENETRCRTHIRSLTQTGPNETARRELTYRQKAEYRRVREDGEQNVLNENDAIRRQRLINDLRHQLDVLKIEHRRAMELLIGEQEDRVRETGEDPDANARRVREEAANARREQQRQQWAAGLELRRIAMLEEEQRQQQEILNAINANRQQQNNVAQLQNRELANFVRDPQNVHTTTAVNQTKEMVNRILKIPVPQEYRWNMIVCSKTPGEIITTCKLTPKATWQMSAKYCQDEDIYNMGKGIYGKVLDGVWQYTLSSPNKDAICQSLKQEMEDNIGMCAQGNLSRLCNILAGFMEGIGSQESYSEVLQRKIPKLMEIEDLEERIKQAYTIFVESGVPEGDWDKWLLPLIDDQLDDEEDAEYYKFNRIRDNNNNITGIVVEVLPYTVNYDN